MNITSIDWYTVTLLGERYSDVVSFCEVLFGDRERMDGKLGYRHCERFGERAYLRHSRMDDGSLLRPDMSLEVPGSSLSYFSVSEILDLFHATRFEFEGRPTRVDLAVDDYEWVMHPRKLMELIDKGELVVKGLHVGNGVRDADGVGGTQYFGRRGKLGSGACLRFYDKNSESGGRLNCGRWEVEFSKGGEKAERVVDELLKCNGDYEEVAKKITALVFGVVDFVDQEGKRLDWYESLVGL